MATVEFKTTLTKNLNLSENLLKRFRHQIWGSPIIIGVALYFLWTILGPSALAGWCSKAVEIRCVYFLSIVNI